MTGHATLAQTDPELVAYFDAFALDEVGGHGGLDSRTRLLVQLSALVATQASSEYRLVLEATLAAGVTPVEVREVVYQAVPYVGMGKAVDFVHLTNDVLREHGVELPLPPQSTTTSATRGDAGLAVQKQIVGADAVDSMYASASPDVAHVQRYLSANCFGDHYTRTGLDVPTRELLTLSMLAAMGGADPQVAGHVAANLNVGNDRTLMVAVVTQLLPYIGYPRTLNALRAIEEGAS